MLGNIGNAMQDGRSIASPPNPPSGAPPKPKPLGRALFWAFFCCFLWWPLSALIALIAYLSELIPRPLVSIYRIVFDQFWLPVIFAALILYPACFTKHSPLFRAFLVLLIGAALLGCALFVWLVIIRPPLAVRP